MKPRRKTRKELLNIIRQLQDLVGRAEGNYHNDRANDRFEAVVPHLQKAFQLCLNALEAEEPV